MTPSLTALTAYLAWALTLLMISIAYRGAMVASGKRAAHHWTRGRDSQDPKFFKNAADAFSNCAETAAIFVGIIMLAHVTNQSAITDGLAMIFVGARVLQSIAHIASLNHWMIFLVRFPAFFAQVLIMMWWLLQLSGCV